VIKRSCHILYLPNQYILPSNSRSSMKSVLFSFYDFVLRICDIYGARYASNPPHSLWHEDCNQSSPHSLSRNRGFPSPILGLSLKVEIYEFRFFDILRVSRCAYLRKNSDPSNLRLLQCHITFYLETHGLWCFWSFAALSDLCLNTRNYLRTETDPASEMLCFIFFTILQEPSVLGVVHIVRRR
jgi:hypothetical protein